MGMKIDNCNEVNCPLCLSTENEPVYRFDYQKYGLKQKFDMVACRHCGLLYNKNRPHSSDIAKLYNNGYYLAPHGSVRKRDWVPAVEDYLNKIRPLESIVPGRKLLDIGCNMGFLLKVARDNGWRVKGVDTSIDAVEYGKKELGLEIIVGRVEEINFGNDKFDLICALDLLEHLEDPLSFLKLCHHLLADEGILVLETPNAGSIYRKLSGRFWVGFNPYHIQLFSPDTISMLISKSDFETVELYSTYNDIMAAKNLWRWFANIPVLRIGFNGFRFCMRIFSKKESNGDIASMNAEYAGLKKIVDVKGCIESRNSLIARKLLGDQLIVLLRKRSSPVKESAS
jgi:2-polyprenyl-3-methyl-5-hydroxy-6-metoxy-1,4-benzoquinol methylase